LIANSTKMRDEITR